MGADDQVEKMALDGEDISMQVDKLEAEQRGKKIDVDMEKVEKEVEDFLSLAKAGQKQQAIDGLLTIEKQGRLAEDISSTKLACKSILQVREVLGYIAIDSIFQPPLIHKISDHFVSFVYITDSLRCW
jgi:hypothetical protein